MVSGGCHCGAVKFEVSEEIQGIIHCHCETCRKINGTVYGSTGFVPEGAFKIISGKNALTPYESSPGKNRWFCSRCGAHVFARSQASPDMVGLRIGTIDGDPGIRSKTHIWVSQKRDWYDLNDDLPRFEEFPG